MIIDLTGVVYFWGTLFTKFTWACSIMVRKQCMLGVLKTFYLKVQGAQYFCSQQRIPSLLIRYDSLSPLFLLGSQLWSCFQIFQAPKLRLKVSTLGNTAATTNRKMLMSLMLFYSFWKKSVLVSSNNSQKTFRPSPHGRELEFLCRFFIFIWLMNWWKIIHCLTALSQSIFIMV